MFVCVYVCVSPMKIDTLIVYRRVLTFLTIPKDCEEVKPRVVPSASVKYREALKNEEGSIYNLASGPIAQSIGDMKLKEV